MEGHGNLPPSAIYPIFPLMICATSQANSNMSIIPILFGSKTAKRTQDPFSLDSWDPFSTLVSISSTALSLDNVEVDWKETPTAHVFKADLPGLKKDEVKVEVEEQRFLTISGQRSAEVEDKDHKWHRVRRSFGKFLGSISLPEDAAVGGAKAALENGVLTVTVPKEKDKKLQARVIRIEG